MRVRSTLRCAPRGAAGLRPVACAAAILLAPGAALAAPVLGKSGGVTSGAASIAQAGTVTTIDQATPVVTINWQSFSTAPSESVNFIQPGANAIALNRVLGNETSVLQGALNATGKVFLINSNGVLFTRGSSVNTAGFVASTLDLSDAQFDAGDYSFAGAAAGAAVTNYGTITARGGGYVALLGGAVSNQGLLSAEKGTVALAAGSRVTLEMGGAALLGVDVTQGALDALVANRQAILADGGRVILTAKAADELLSAQVNNAGLIQARTVDDLQGTITLRADGGSVQVAGTLDASAPGLGDGGRIETSGTRVSIADGTSITTASARGHAGNWLIDPDGFTIGSGGDISGATLGNELDHGNVTIASTQGHGSDGNVDVNDAVTWSASTTLSLNASHDINVNAAITASGASAGLAMNYGGFAASGSAVAGTDYYINNLTVQSDGSVVVGPASITLSGANASLAINGQSYTLIHSVAQLAAISPVVVDANGNPVVDPNTGVFEFVPASGNYALAQDLDASGTSYAYAVVSSLTGTLAGLGHAISHLTIAATAVNPYNQVQDAALVDTFGADTTSQLRDLSLLGVDIVGGGTAAGLVAFNNGSIRNVYVSGTITGSQPVGAIAGWNLGTIDGAHGDVSVAAPQAGIDVGGLVGVNSTPGLLANSTVKGSVSASGINLADGGLIGSQDIGGLAGSNAGVIDNCHAYVAVSATDSFDVGGLVGGNLNVMLDTSHGIVSNSSASGSVSIVWDNTLVYGFSYGGLVGDNSGGFISNSTANVAVTTRATTTDASGLVWPIYYVGGLVGSNETFLGFGGTITNSTASGNVTAIGTNYQVGGAVGDNFDGTLVGVHASGNVTNGAAGETTGGLVGSNEIGTISASSASGSVSGGDQVGGLIGSNGGTIQASTSSGSVAGRDQVGGLVGYNAGAVSGSSASGVVSGRDYVGGLAGVNVLYDFGDGNVANGVITASSASGAVTGDAHVGGLVGYNGGVIDTSSASGAVAGAADAGALVGTNGGSFASSGDAYAGSITNSDATGSVVPIGAASNVGGLVGQDNGSVSGSSYLDVAGVTTHLVDSLAYAPPRTTDAVLPQASPAQTGAALDAGIVYGGGYAVDVQSITVDGVRFDLDDQEAGKPRQAPQPEQPQERDDPAR